jgi:hypothetical protein
MPSSSSLLGRRAVLRAGGLLLAGLAAPAALRPVRASDVVEIRLWSDTLGTKVWFDPIGLHPSRRSLAQPPVEQPRRPFAFVPLPPAPEGALAIPRISAASAWLSCRPCHRPQTSSNLILRSPCSTSVRRIRPSPRGTGLNRTDRVLPRPVISCALDMPAATACRCLAAPLWWAPC